MFPQKIKNILEKNKIEDIWNLKEEIKQNFTKEEQKYDAMLYNAILGGTANSKMFQEVREKEEVKIWQDINMKQVQEK